MEALGGVMVSLDDLVAECAKTWPTELASTLTTPTTAGAVALAALVDAARNGMVSTLPYACFDKGVIHWVSFGKDFRLLMEYAEDLRSWVMHGYGAIGDLEFARSDLKGRLGHLLHKVSPAGYLRWATDAQTFPNVLTVLGRMHSFLDGMPTVQPALAPSLHVLRFRFVSALRLGEWMVAESIIDEIDQWNLEQAHKTMQMRLRVLGESGNHARLLEMVDSHNLWALTHPTRVAEAILEAILHEVLYPLEATDKPDLVCQGIRPWYSRIISILPSVSPIGKFTRLFAYVACLDGDGPSALALRPHLFDPLRTFIDERFGVSAEPEIQGVQNLDSTSSTAKSMVAIGASTVPGEAFWNSLVTLVRQGAVAAIARHLSELDARVLDSEEYLSFAPDALLEMISDPDIEAHAASRNALQEVLTALVDVSFSVPGFPSPKHLNLYLSLAEALVYVRGASASHEDAHLLHGLLAAIANLSPKAAHGCASLLRSWWQLRPILPRLDWLLAVLESIAPLLPDPSLLVDLWVQAIALATRKKSVLSPSQFRTWQRVAEMLELDADSVASDLSALRPQAPTCEVDVLGSANLHKIAIVSLQEGAAREAARELQDRTGADVAVVTSLVQDGLTKAAANADLILFVWAACSHAVYRAFDEHRDRVAYVQGTGASSIVLAAESWVIRRVAILTQ
jgi:hypothetical protein